MGGFQAGDDVLVVGGPICHLADVFVQVGQE
jgi:hypothetical protein